MANVLGRRAYNTRSGRIIQNVLPKIILIDSDIQSAGYLAFLNRLKSKKTMQEKITWDTDEFSPITDTLSAAVSSTTQTSIPVTAPTYYVPGELWQNSRTLEIVQVLSVNTGTSNLTVVRAVTALNSSGGTAAANMNSGDTLNKIAPAVSENSQRQVSRTTTPTEVFNFTQIFRKDLSMSDRQIKREFENDNELNYWTTKKTKEFRMDLDRQFLFGERARYTDSAGDDVTMTGGIKPFISTNVLSVGGTLFKSTFDEFLVEKGLRFGSANKIMFASTNIILAMTQMLDTIAQFEINVSGDKNVRIGTQVLHYMAPNGRDLLIVEDRNISEQWNGEGYIVDMTQLEKRVFSNNGRSGEFQLIRGTEDPDDKGNVDTFYGDMGITYGYEKSHAKLTNVEGGSYSVPVT